MRIGGLGWEAGPEVWEFERARHFPYDEWVIVTVEGRVVRSYEEVVALASEDAHKNKEYLDVVFLPMVVGG